MSTIKRSPLDAYQHRSLKSAGMLSNSTYGIGSNAYGEYGLNNDSPYTKYQATGFKDIVDVWCSLAYYQIDADGSLWSSGYNTYGELAQNDVIYRSSPVQIPGVWDSFLKNNGNSYHNGFAYKNDGSLWGWGYNPHGILFTNDTVHRSSPIQLFASGDYLKPSAGYSHMTMLKSDGTLWALGYNGYGGLGQDDIVPRSSPVQLGSDTDWVDSAAGHYFSLGLKSNGTLWAWGYNVYGELGVSSVVPRSSPVQIPGQWSDIGGDTHRAYAKEVTTNRFYTWGYNSVGSHGNGDAIPRSSPIYLGGDGNWKSVDATYNYSTYMVDYNNNLWGVGTNNSRYQIDSSQLPRSNPIQITTGVSVEKMAAGSNGGLILASNNNILGETADPSNILTNQIYGII